MRYYFIELLACPECKSPLRTYYVIKEDASEVDVDVEKVRCGTWCGLHRKPADQVPIEECRKCVKRDIVEGVLICTNCGRWYPITDGIPILIDDKFRREKEDREFLEKNLDKIPVEVRLLMKKPPLPVKQ
ncbi:MAG: Trm112 family protein [Desulfurococcales archaeon]|nr:Trm112 family protein [Desulfurococcales archaeon]